MLLFASSLLIGGAILEGGLRLFTPFPIHSDDANRDPHEALGYVVSPAFADIDAQGFRNPSDARANGRIELFALGDSHTFGQNVPSEQSWPRQLGKLASLRVYNYGVGGYGILQYAYLFDRALDRQPDHVVVGLYLANDFARFCKWARTPYWRESLARFGIETKGCERDGVPPGQVTWGDRARNWAKSTALGSALIHHVWYPLEARLAERGVDTTAWELRYGDGQRQTFQTFFPRSRLEAGSRMMDLSDPETAAADRAARALFARMANSASQRGVKLSVLMIPSKENAILDSLPATTPHLDSIRKLVKAERELVDRYRRFFDEIGVESASGRQSLAAAMQRTSVYPESADSHPLAMGYLAYAEAALPLVAGTREEPAAASRSGESGELGTAGPSNRKAPHTR